MGFPQQEDTGVGSDRFAVEFGNNSSPAMRMKLERSLVAPLAAQDLRKLSSENIVNTLRYDKSGGPVCVRCESPD